MRLDPEIERDLVERARISPTAFGELYDHYKVVAYSNTFSITLKTAVP